tara:strand:+ start:1505 stop:1759 length:255 start_codon:yes stop_codon:yes gene_type:complete
MKTTESLRRENSSTRCRCPQNATPKNPTTSLVSFARRRFNNGRQLLRYKSGEKIDGKIVDSFFARKDLLLSLNNNDDDDDDDVM